MLEYPYILPFVLPGFDAGARRYALPEHGECLPSTYVAAASTRCAPRAPALSGTRSPTARGSNPCNAREHRLAAGLR
eukprot:1862566-Lingulodinium_polyedra.AAC.1